MPALFAVLVPVAVVPLERSRLLVAAVVPWAVVSLGFLRFTFPAELEPVTGSPHMLAVVISGSGHPVTTDDFQIADIPMNRHLAERASGIYQGYQRLGGWTGPLRPAPGGPRIVVVEYAVGLSSYLLPTDVYVLDALGLGDAFTAHLELERRGLPGHEKALPAAWIWARFVHPDFAADTDLLKVPGMMSYLSGTDIEQRSDAELAADVAAAREVLACPELERLERVTRRRLTPGRVLGNFVDAFRLSRLRIPSDPQEAVRALC
jgi:arabinofuranosyltransferase